MEISGNPYMWKFMNPAVKITRPDSGNMESGHDH